MAKVDIKKEFPSLIKFLEEKCKIVNMGEPVDTATLQLPFLIESESCEVITIGEPVRTGLLVSYPLSSKGMDVGELNLDCSSDGKIIVSKSATINPRAIDRWNNGLPIMLTAYVSGDKTERGRDEYQEIPFP